MPRPRRVWSPVAAALTERRGRLCYSVAAASIRVPVSLSTQSPPPAEPTGYSLSPRRSLVALVVLAAAYVLPGLIGHDPWKQDEAYSFGIIYNLVRTGDWVVPTLAADPFMEKPPAYYMTAAGFVKLFSPPLEMHDAARLATGLYLGLALLFTGLLGRETWGSGYGAPSVAVLISCLGLLQHGHFMITDTALLAGMTMAGYGLLLGRRSDWGGGFWIGMGGGLAFLSKGLLGPGIVGLTALLLPAVFRPWRSAVYARALLVAVLCALPWLLIWPAALYLRSPELFLKWFWDNNFGRYLGFAELGPPTKEGFWLRSLPWITFPALPLALWSLWAKGRSVLTADGVRLVLVLSLVGWAILFASSTARDLYAMPLLPPLAVLAAGALSSLPELLIRAGYWTSLALFALLAILLWTLWVFMQVAGAPPALPGLADAMPMDFVPRFQPWAFGLALALSIGWAWTLWRFRPPGAAALLSWPAGLILAWGLGATLHLAWVDHGKSYRTVFHSLEQAMPEDYDCLADIDLRESERGLLHYFAGLTTRHIDSPEESPCNLILVETKRTKNPDPVDLGPDWTLVWEGNRPADDRDWFLLFRRSGP